MIRWPFTRKSPAKPSPSERLAATLRPDPLYRERRLAQFDAARRARYFRNVEGLRG